MTTPLLTNILDQAQALQVVSDYHFGPGRKTIEQAAALIRGKKKVLLSGMGASCFACVPLQHALARLGFEVLCLETSELLYFPPVSLSDDWVSVLVSRSGESIEIIKILEKLAGASVVGISNVEGSSLSQAANVAMVLKSPPDQLVAVQTYTSTLAVFALILACIAGELDGVKKELDQTIRILGNSIPRWVGRRAEWRSFLHGHSPLYLLGRGPALGSVSEGVLLMHETAKAPTVGMSVAQFRHGPVEVVDSSFRAVIVGTQPETVGLDAALANDITAMGGQVRWLGPAVQGCLADPLCEWPDDIPARFRSICEIIPLQIAAYAKAELAGLRPGDFRWATAVTNTETGFGGLSQFARIL